MPRPLPLVPPYRHHKPRDLAYTVVAGRKVYLGPYGSPASREQHARIVREAASAIPVAAQDLPRVDPAAYTVAALLAGFWDHAKRFYAYDASYEGRRPPGEIGNYHDAMRPVLKLYAGTPAVEFGPRSLKLVQEEMIASGWCRNVVNRQTCRITHMFKWAVSEERIPESVHTALMTVPGVSARHAGVRNTDDVTPVDPADLEATLKFLSPRLATMARLQLYTGMRSSNLCEMRTADVDRTGKGNWRYKPRRHKTQHHGHKLVIPLGPQARDVLRPYLKPDEPEAFIFSPADEQAERRAARSAARVTPARQGNRPGSKPAKRAPRRQAGGHYSPRTYAQAIGRACDRADRAARAAAEQAGVALEPGQRLVKPWHPHQLRHNKGTAVRAAYGLEGVQAALGQKTAKVAERYAEIEAEKAERIAAELG